MTDLMVTVKLCKLLKIIFIYVKRRKNKINVRAYSNLFLISLVPLQLIATNKNKDKKVIIWKI